MIELPVLLAFCAATAALAAMPGPNVAVILATGAVHGRRAALSVVLGTTLAGGLQIALVVFGLTALIETWSLAWTVIRWAGIAYLVWLGINLIRQRPAALDGARAVHGRLFLRGVATSLANPKTLVFHAAFLPLFVDPARPAGPQLAVLAAVFLVLVLVLDGLWALAGGSLKAVFASDRLKTWANRVSGGAMLLAAGWLALRREVSST